jgi:hypothetical protein
MIEIDISGSKWMNLLGLFWGDFWFVDLLIFVLKQLQLQRFNNKNNMMSIIRKREKRHCT